jgi:hypothetical protein
MIDLTIEQIHGLTESGNVVLRTVAKHCVDAIQREAKLREALESAPHSGLCNIIGYTELGCNCWKARALTSNEYPEGKK